jgi:hypothetical protein
MRLILFVLSFRFLQLNLASLLEVNFKSCNRPARWKTRASGSINAAFGTIVNDLHAYSKGGKSSQRKTETTILVKNYLLLVVLR